MNRSATRSALQATAVHEAGHAIVGWVVGRQALTQISIEPDEAEGTLGHVTRRRMYRKAALRLELGGDDILPVVLPLVQACFAGVIAERRVGRRHNWAGARTDLSSAADLVARLGGSARATAALSKWQWIETEERVSFWFPAIEELAERLIESRTLTGRDAREAILTIMRTGAGAPPALRRSIDASDAEEPSSGVGR